MLDTRPRTGRVASRERTRQRLVGLYRPATSGKVADMTIPTSSMKVGLRRLFPTLVAEIDHPDPAELNVRLAAFIRRVRDEDPPEKRGSTVHGGWRSTSALLKHDVPEIRAIRAFFDKGIEAYFSSWASEARTPYTSSAFTQRYKGWAVILSEGGYQQQHVHSRMDLVGVYCVERPRSPEGDSTGGELTLIDPRTGRLSTRAAWETELVSLAPVPGRLFLFPSFVAHRVERVLAPGERVTINFDVIVQDSGP